jgi:exopolysaccharide biosynthesis polyprenyl glycosylphosphotransferase
MTRLGGHTTPASSDPSDPITSINVPPPRPPATLAGTGRSERTDGTDLAARVHDSTSLAPLWAVRYRIVLVTLDLCCIIVASVAGYLVRFGNNPEQANTVSYLLVGLAIALGWVVLLQWVGGYEIRHLATGPEEAKRVLRASALTVSVIAVGCYATKTDVARGYVVGVIPIGIVLLLFGRTLARSVARRRRAQGGWCYRILAVGTSESVRHLFEVTERARGAGLKIVAVCVEDAERDTEFAPGVPVVGGVREAADAADRIDADVVAVTSNGLGPGSVRELGWQLEGTGRGLVMAPALTEVAGPRVHVSPVEGLPLFWLEQPQLGRLPRVVKRTVDLVGAIVLLVLALPVLLLTALLIRITSTGPVLFRQRRLGVYGEPFTILKFRSMYADAEAQREVVFDQNEQDGGGVLFKIRRDPRVTPVGRWIRRLSIDELPQLINVISGSMSLVGPRPLAAIDSNYTGAARRRLLVRPGITGLWQVSGRSELSWDDAVRLDLYYVENWSLGLDTSILLRTIVAVLIRKGAY